MNVLYDFVTMKFNFFNGGTGYNIEVLNRLAQESDVKIYAFQEAGVEIPLINKNEIHCNVEDTFYSNGNDEDKLIEFVKENNIEVFFIGIASLVQRTHNFENLPCRIISVCHDIANLIMSYEDKNKFGRPAFFIRKYVFNHSDWHIKLSDIKAILFRKIKSFSAYENMLITFSKDNYQLITVSEYSKSSIHYYLGKPKNEIKIFYPPLKKIDQENITKNEIKNYELNKLINNNERYFLLISTDRTNKNAAIFVEQWNRFCKETNFEYKAVLIGKNSFKHQNIINIDYLEKNDLEAAYKNAFAFVYPSIAEGWGYPPVEAMRYGIPVIASNATSVPEVLGDTAFYFNPYYPEDLYSKMLECVQNPKKFSDSAEKRFLTILSRQQDDLEKLITLILGK